MTEFEALQQQVARMAKDKRELRKQVQDEALARAKVEADVAGLELELEAVRAAAKADRDLAPNPEHFEVAAQAGEHVGNLLHQLAEFGAQAPLEQGFGGSVLEAAKAIVELREGKARAEKATAAYQVDGEKLVRMAREDLDRVTKRIEELDRELDRALDAILLASAHDNWGPAHDLCVKHERVLPSTPRPKDVLGELHGRLAAMRGALTETLRELSSRDRWCGGALSYREDGAGMGCSPACRSRKECAVLHSINTGKPQTEVIAAARPFMEAVPSWDCNKDDDVTVVVTARQTAALCRAFDIMDGKRDEDEDKDEAKTT